MTGSGAGARRIDADVLVVGAGPGGSAAAYHLARQGVDVLLADRSSFPREKVCGDGLTPRAVAALDRVGVDLLDPGFARADGLRTYGMNGRVIDLRWPKLGAWPDYALVRTRRDLDELIVARAVRAGARFRPSFEVGDPVIDRGRVVGARASDEGGEPVEVRARYVIAADGASSRLAAGAGVRRDPTRAIGVAARRYYRSERPFEPVFESFLDIREAGAAIPGYGWIFFLPGGIVNVGAGLLSTFSGFARTSARRVFDAFVRRLPAGWGVDEEHALGPVRSGPLPTAMNRTPLAVPGMLLVGDAAGMVNPYNGEGISTAMESAETAAELVTESLRRGRPGVAQMYPTVLRQRYGRYYFIGNNWARLLGKPAFMRFAVRYGLPRAALMRFALRFFANLTDGRDGDFEDRLMHLLISMAPEGR